MFYNYLNYTCSNKRIIIVLFFFCFHILFSQKGIVPKQNKNDSLKKYSVDVLIQKCYSDINPKIYCNEMFSRKLSDAEKTKCYNIFALKYCFEVINDHEKTIQYLNLSNVYAKKTGNVTFERANLNIIAIIYALENKHEDALKFLEKRNKLKSLEKTDELQELLSGGDDEIIYALLGYFGRSVKGYLDATKKIDDYLATHDEISAEKKYQLIFYKCLKYKNIFLNYSYEKKLDSAGIYLNKIKTSSLLPKDKVDIISSNEANYLILSGRLDEAIQKAKKDKNDYKNDKARVFYNLYYLARAYQLKGNYKESSKYCEQGLNNIFVNIDFINIELELYRIAMENADKSGDNSNYLKYSKLYQEKSKKINYNSKADFIAKLYNLDQIQPLKYELNNSKHFMTYLWLIILFLSLFTAYLINRFFTLRKYKKRFIEINARLEKKEKEVALSPKKAEEVIKTDNNILSLKKENEILDKLNKFEKKQQFLSSTLSLSSLASSMNVNYNYLTLTIKKYKKNNFNGYINQLRIDYIILKLKQNPEYLNYKISYLAEECGFSSHTVFTRIFIEKTGIPPSKFIEYVKKENTKVNI